MIMKIGPKGLTLVKSFESEVLYVYDDLKAPVNGRYVEWDGSKPVGTLTIAFGHTNAAKHPLKITRGLRVTPAQALEILDVDLDECEAYVNRAVRVPITQGMYDALVSLTFNMGEGNMNKSSLLAKLNRGDYDGARAAFDLYVKSGGKTLRGLVRRRDAEQVLWDQGDYLGKGVAQVERPTIDLSKDDYVANTVPGVALPKPGEIIEHSADVDRPPKTITVPAPPPAATAGAGAVVAGGVAAAVAGAPLWVIGVGVAVIAVAGVGIYLLLKKKGIV